MAKTAGVSTRAIVQAKQAERAGLGDDVRDGKVSLKKATAKPKPSATKKAKPKQESQPADETPELHAHIEELAATVKELIAENNSMGAVLDADDRLPAQCRAVVRWQPDARRGQRPDKDGAGFFTWGKDAADLAEEARKWTLVVECWK